MKKPLLTIGIVALLAVIALAIYLGIKKSKSIVLSDGTVSDAAFPLKYNSVVKYDAVKSLQNKLNNKLEEKVEPDFPKDKNGQYIKNLVEDGYFGPNTLAVVKYLFDGKEEVTLEMYNSLV